MIVTCVCVYMCTHTYANVQYYPEVVINVVCGQMGVFGLSELESELQQQLQQLVSPQH